MGLNYCDRKRKTNQLDVPNYEINMKLQISLKKITH